MFRKSNLFLMTGILFITASLCLTGFNVWDDHRAGEDAGAAAASVISVVEESRELTAAADVEVVPDYILKPDMDMPSVKVDEDGYIGVLSIPALDRELPVMETWSDAKLKTAPCCYQGSIYQGDAIIAGHNYNSHFGGLHRLEPNDTVVFTDVDGNVFEYQVSEIETIEETDFDGMNAGDWDMTLFTCTYDSNSRVTVRCTQV